MIKVETLLCAVQRSNKINVSRRNLARITCVLLLSGSLPTPAAPSKLRCQNTPVDQALSLVLRVNQPEILIPELIQHFEPTLAAYLHTSPTLHMHERARLARVPILMYHDILPQKQVFFDVTPSELARHFEYIKSQGVTPVSLTQLIAHLRTGVPLPQKPIVLTFDDGYSGHYDYVYPLLKKFGYPATFSIYTSNLGKNTGRPHINWEQLRRMAADPLVTIAAHSVTHPADLTQLPPDKLVFEIAESKRMLQARLGIPIRYFTYPAGKYDQKVADTVAKMGYEAALTMDDTTNRFAGESENLLAIARIGQPQINQALARAWSGTLPTWGVKFDFSAAITLDRVTRDRTQLILIAGGKPITIHAPRRDQVPNILAGTSAIAGVDGGFFSLKFLNSNTMIGPVLSHNGKNFIRGSDNHKLANRPLVLINSHAVKFIAFNPQRHNTRAGLNAVLTNVTDAFVAAAWLVKDGQPQSASSFGSLFDFDAARHCAFWRINQAGQPTIGVSTTLIDSVALGKAVALAGLHNAVMLDSGASTSLAYKGESLVSYVPRPVPHVVALMPPQHYAKNCAAQS